MFDINDGIERFYRDLIAEEIEKLILNYGSNDEYRWFNEGVKLAAIVAKNGISYEAT